MQERPLAAVSVQSPAPKGAWLKSQSLFLFVVLGAQLMVVLDGTIVNVALPHIQNALRFSSADLSWVLNAYVLTFGGLLLLGARSGDLLGRRRTFLFGVALFALASFAGGFAASSWELLAARAVQGIGAAFAAPSSLSLLTSAYPEGAQRTRAIGMFTTVSVAGAATGLVAGGLLTQYLSWRWVMFVNVPIGIVVLAVGALVLKETPRRHGRFDLAGAITSTVGTTSVVLGLVQAGDHGWSSALTLVPLVAGVVLLALFISQERRVDEPILPLHLLANATRSTANLARGLSYAGMYGMFFFLSQFFQDIQHYSPLRAGIAFLPMPLSVFLGSRLAARAMGRRVQPKRLMMTGLSLAVVALALVTRAHAGEHYLEFIPAMVLMGAGMGICLVSLTAAALSGVAPKDAGAASGLVNVVQQIGAALGLAVLVTVFSGVTHHRQGAQLTNALMVHGLHYAFAAAVIFALASLVLVALAVPGRPRARRTGAPDLRALGALAEKAEAV